MTASRERGIRLYKLEEFITVFDDLQAYCDNFAKRQTRTAFTLADTASYIDKKKENAMDLKPYACELPYPEIEPVENIADSKLLMPNYGGPAGELTAITTYCFQFYITDRNKELKDTLEGIAKVEMHHHELLGETIFKLGGYPVMGGRTYWSGSFVNYTVDPKKFLRQNITAEETAILNYERTVLSLHTESVKTLLERIILDEELHIKIFKELLATM